MTEATFMKRIVEELKLLMQVYQSAEFFNSEAKHRSQHIMEDRFYLIIRLILPKRSGNIVFPIALSPIDTERFNTYCVNVLKIEREYLNG